MHVLAALLLVTLSRSAPPYTQPLVETVNRAAAVQTVLGSSDLVDAHFSPDGRRIAWSSRDGVYVANVDGSRKRLIEPSLLSTCPGGPCEGFAVAWSPDSRALLISGGGKLTNALQLYSLATGRLTDVAPRRRGYLYSALGFGRDGHTVVYTRGTDRNVRDAYDVFVGKRVAYRVGSWHYEGSSPTLSPDGRQVAFVLQTERGNVIRVVDLSNGDAHDIRGFSPAFQLSWSPDSRRIAFPNMVQGSWETETVAAAGGQAKDVGPGNVVVWARDGELLLVRANYTELWSGGKVLFRAPHDFVIDWVDAI